MENNPISKIDLLGDTTSYYTSDGKFWYTSPDNLKNSTVIISAEKEEAFFQHYYENYALVPDEKRDLNAMNTDLRTFGTGYDIASFEKFYDDNGKSVPAKTVDGTPTDEMSDIRLNGKPAKLYAEVQGNLVMKDGMITVGKEKQSAGDMTHAFPSDLPWETGKVGHIHTHPLAVPTTLDYRRGNFYSGGIFPTPGPSGADHTRAGNNKGGVRNVVVDSKNVYLINGNSSQTIKISRR